MEQTPPTPTPQAQPTDRYTQLLEATLRENNQRIQLLQDQLNSIPTQPRQEPEPVSSDPAAFFNNPQGELEKFRKTINEDLQRTIAPLLKVAQGLRGDGTPYGNLKNQFKNDPRYSQILSDPKVEFAVDKIMETQQQTPELMKAAIIQAAGLKSTGELDVALVASGVDLARFQSAPAPTHTPQAPPPVPPVPAHMRPTNPTPPAPQQQNPNSRPLTELEKRLARERGMTDQQYLDWLTVPASAVASSQIGRTPK